MVSDTRSNDANIRDCHKSYGACTVYETHNYFATVFNNGRMVDGGDLPIDFRTNAIIGPNVQFLNKGKETYWHFLTSSQ